MRSPSDVPIISSGAKPSSSVDTRADKGAAAFAIEGHDQVGKTLHQAAREFLLAVQALLHLPAFGDVHERSLMPADTPTGIADQSGGVQAGDRGAVAAAQADLMAVDGRRTGPTRAARLPIFRAAQKVRERTVEQLVAVFVAEHARERRDSRSRICRRRSAR